MFFLHFLKMFLRQDHADADTLSAALYIGYAKALLKLLRSHYCACQPYFFCLMRSKSLLRPCQVCGEGKEKSQAAKQRSGPPRNCPKGVLKRNGRRRWRCVTFVFLALLSKPLYSTYRIKVKSNFEEQTFFYFNATPLGSTAAKIQEHSGFCCNSLHIYVTVLLYYD